MKRCVLFFLAILMIIGVFCVGTVPAFAVDEENEGPTEETITAEEVVEESDGQILFNDIAWGSDYPTVLAALKDIFGVSFSNPYYEKVKADKDLKDPPFSLATGFDVYSSMPVKVAGVKAYIRLHFVYPNEGGIVQNENNDNAVLTMAEYYLWIRKSEPDSSKMPEIASSSARDSLDEDAHDLKLKLESIYGKTDPIGGGFFGAGDYYEKNGPKDTRIWMGYSALSTDGFGEFTITYSVNRSEIPSQDVNSSLIKKMLEEEKERRQKEKEEEQKEHDAEVVSGDKSGL